MQWSISFTTVSLLSVAQTLSLTPKVKSWRKQSRRSMRKSTMLWPTLSPQQLNFSFWRLAVLLTAAVWLYLLWSLCSMFELPFISLTFVLKLLSRTKIVLHERNLVTVIIQSLQFVMVLWTPHSSMARNLTKLLLTTSLQLLFPRPSQLVLLTLRKPLCGLASFAPILGSWPVRRHFSTVIPPSKRCN